MNILITGTSGYIGNALKNYLKKEHLITTFSFSNDNFDALNLQNIDCIFHLSALVHQKKAFSLEEYLHVNLSQSVKLAKKAKQSGVKKFVFMSSVSVYGDEVEKIDELTPCSPKTFYAKSKFEAENALQCLNEENFIVISARIPMVYGKNAPGNINSLIKLIKICPILPFAKIDNKRSFVYIENLLYFLEKLICYQKSEIFLFCDDEAISTSYLVKKIAFYLEKKPLIIKLYFFEFLLKKLKPSLYKKLFSSLYVNNTQTKQKLHFKNPYTMSEGIKEMLS